MPGIECVGGVDGQRVRHVLESAVDVRVVIPKLLSGSRIYLAIKDGRFEGLPAQVTAILVGVGVHREAVVVVHGGCLQNPHRAACATAVGISNLAAKTQISSD